MKLKALLIFTFLLQSAYAELAWKTVIYMQADNDLSPYAFWDLREIASATKESQRSKTLVHLDLPGVDKIYEFEVLPDSEDISNDLEHYKNATLSDYNIKLISTIDESEDVSQKERLLNFLKRIDSQYPSQNTMLVIWGHGEGYGNGAQFGGVALDSNPSTRLGIQDIKQTIDEFYQLGHEKLSIIAMDACLMQSFEVVSSMATSSNYFIGSAQIQNFQGLPYNLILDYINNEVEDQARVSSSKEDYYLAKKLPELFSKSEFALSSETMSAVAGEELERSFLPSFYELFLAINKYLDANPYEVFGLKSELSKVPFFLGDSRDLSTALGHIESYFLHKDSEISKLVANAQINLSYSLISYSYGTDYGEQIQAGYHLGSFKAFALWLPTSKEQYFLRINQFNESELYKNTYFQQYRLFLENLFNRSFVQFAK